MDADDILSDMLLEVPETPVLLLKTRKRKAPPENLTSKKHFIEPPAPSSVVLSDDKNIDLDTICQDSGVNEDSSVDQNVDQAAQDWQCDNPIVQATSDYTHFYWYDVCEGPTQGTVYFFGRVQVPDNKFVSCCVIVKNVCRSVYLLIKPFCSFDEVVAEFTNIIAKKYKIKNFTCKKVTKRFAFDSQVPIEADYVMIDYPANQQALPLDLIGGTFSKVLNANQSPMEKLILEMKLRGPAWLRLTDPVASSPQITWTKVELVINSPSNLSVEDKPVNLSRPYFCVLSLALQTHAHPNVPGRNDIVAISVMVNTCFRLDQCLNRNNKGCGHFLIMAKPQPSQKDPLRLPFDFPKAIKSFTQTRFELAENERDLLTMFMEKFNQLDPDIVVGHDLLNYDFETLVRQMAINKVGVWDKLGRFKRNTLPSSKKAFPNLFSGRVLCDIKKSAEELMQLRSYDLTELTLQILNQKRVEYNHSLLKESYKSSESLIQMLTAVWRDVDSIFSILVELNIIPLALKITNITGNILSRTLAAGRSERNEYLLLHAFHEDNYICPEKIQAWEKKFPGKNADGGDDKGGDNNPGRRKAAYTGGLVLEPKTGFYESCVLLMDFNSLYPSIIQEFNICFTTVKVPENSDEGAAEIVSESDACGILPTQLKQLVQRRKEVKNKLKVCKDPMQSTLLDIEQRALKLTANSMYGCLGFEYSRFYAKHLASLVTLKGREILLSTKAMVENLGYEVIYGDTDSLMIDTKLTEFLEVMQRGTTIKTAINRRFKLLEIDVDGVYQPLLLLKKKNYAGASLTMGTGGTIVKKIETKGLDSVRRDRAVIAKEAGERILSMIMESGKEICQTVQDIHAYLKELSEQVKKNELPISKYLISKQLNKNPDEYRDTKGIGHVTIALRLNADPKRARKLRSGDVIEYAICTDGTGESANQRGYTLEEMANNENLKIDHEYYLCQQIYAAVSRICDKLPFTNAYAIAEAMGIESCSSIKIPRDATVAVMKDQLVSKGEQRFVTCEPLTIECPACTCIEKIHAKTRKATKGNKLIYALVECSNCSARYASYHRKVVVQIIAHLKRLTFNLYNSKFTCPDCEHSSRNIFGPLNEQGRPVCVKCSATLVADMDDRLMDLQLSYFKYLLDIHNDNNDANASQIEKPTDDTLGLYKDCFDEVLGALRMSFTNTIDAQTVLSMVCSGR
uniref:DNA polymerase n=1 Tax=Aceria tosichella TaxID=561515 RepID=A0A6G1SDH0_9ACAR